MGKVHEALTADLQAFIEAQPVSFVATAPLGASGHVNVSPKGLPTMRVLGARQVAYLDYVGSGAETIAHLRENGRITIMFCAFTGPPKILRLYGRGTVCEPGTPRFDDLRPRFPPAQGTRAIIVVDVERIADSCGFGVPLMSFERHRTQLDDWAARKGPEAVAAYQREKNRVSLDGLPALRWVERET